MKNRLVIFDIDSPKVLKARDGKGDWFKLKGSCKRCGKCCLGNNPDCPELVFEMVDDERKGKCKLQRKGLGKPWACMIYPRNPHAELDEGCGFKWVKG